MKLELETNLTDLDKIIAHAEAVANGAQETKTLEKLAELGLTPAALLERLRALRGQIHAKEFAVLKAASELDHELARTLGVPATAGWPGHPAADPCASLLQLLGLDDPAATDAIGVPRIAALGYTLSGGSRGSSLSWSFPHGSFAAPGSAPKPPGS